MLLTEMKEGTNVSFWEKVLHIYFVNKFLPGLD